MCVFLSLSLVFPLSPSLLVIPLPLLYKKTLGHRRASRLSFIFDFNLGVFRTGAPESAQNKKCGPIFLSFAIEWCVSSMSKRTLENLKYPTRKPLQLLQKQRQNTSSNRVDGGNMRRFASKSSQIFLLSGRKSFFKYARSSFFPTTSLWRGDVFSRMPDNPWNDF